jgi:protein-disulfide isomerase
MKHSTFIIVVMLVTTLLRAHAEQDAAPTNLTQRVTELERVVSNLQQEIKVLRGQLAELARRPTSSEIVPSVLVGTKVSILGAPVMGNEGARLALVEYSDFQCPFCRRHALETLPRLRREFVETGKLRYVFRHLPLDRLHPQSRSLAGFAVCAQQQEKFWQVHDLLFTFPKGMAATSASTLESQLAPAGMDMKVFRTCQQSPLIAGRVSSEVDDARRLGFSSTPSFILGSIESDGLVRIVEVISGAQPFALFKSKIDHALK